MRKRMNAEKMSVKDKRKRTVAERKRVKDTRNGT